MSSDSPKIKILVVEDEPSLQKVILKKLGNSGFEISVTNNVEGALQALQGASIDLIWLDHYLLGSKNGLDLVAELKKEDSHWKKIPIFVVSNTATPDKMKSYMRLGVEKYYTKANASLEQIVADINEIFRTAR